MQWHEPRVSVLLTRLVRTKAWLRWTAHPVAGFSSRRRGVRVKQWPGGDYFAGRDTEGLAEYPAKVAWAIEAASLGDFVHGVLSTLQKTHSENQSQAVEVLAWGDPSSFAE